jgi:hypothetical protein
MLDKDDIFSSHIDRNAKRPEGGQLKILCSCLRCVLNIYIFDNNETRNFATVL